MSGCPNKIFISISYIFCALDRILIFSTFALAGRTFRLAKVPHKWELMFCRHFIKTLPLEFENSITLKRPDRLYSTNYFFIAARNTQFFVHIFVKNSIILCLKNLQYIWIFLPKNSRYFFFGKNWKFQYFFCK